MTQLTIVLSALFNAVVLGFISRRLLGVPVGWPRTILVSLAVSTAFGGFVRYLAVIPGLGALGRPGTDVTGPGNTLQTLLIIGLSLSWVVAIGLAILVILEAIVPTGTLPRPIAWVRGMGGQRRRTRRYAEIIAIAVRHGLGGYLRGRSRVPTGEPTSKIARSLREALSDGGVTFVKLGQMLATRPDLIGPDFTRELSPLQSQVAPGPWSAVEPVLVGELGRPVDEVFADVDRTPIAAASVAQVHGQHCTTAPPSSSRCSGRTPGARSPATSTSSCGSLGGSTGPRSGAATSVSSLWPRASRPASRRSWTTPSSWATCEPWRRGSPLVTPSSSQPCTPTCRGHVCSSWNG